MKGLTKLTLLLLILISVTTKVERALENGARNELPKLANHNQQQLNTKTSRDRHLAESAGAKNVNEMYRIMNPLYDMNQMLSPFYQMYGMDPMTAVMHPYLMNNYQNPFMPHPIFDKNNGKINRSLSPNGPLSSFQNGLQFQTQNGLFPNQQSAPIQNPGVTGSLNAMRNPQMTFSNNIPINGLLNPFINTSGMLNHYMNRSGANPYYALAGMTDTMVGSPFNNYGAKSNAYETMYQMSAMNPFFLGPMGIGSPWISSGISPSDPMAPPTNNHSDLSRI